MLLACNTAYIIHIHATAFFSITAHRFSYLELSQNRLTSMLAVANRSAQRLKEMDMLKKGPHFVRTNKNH